MLRLLEEMEGVLEARNHARSSDRFDISYKDDLEHDSDLHVFIRPLEAKFHENVGGTP